MAAREGRPEATNEFKSNLKKWIDYRRWDAGDVGQNRLAALISAKNSKPLTAQTLSKWANGDYMEVPNDDILARAARYDGITLAKFKQMLHGEIPGPWAANELSQNKPPQRSLLEMLDREEDLGIVLQAAAIAFSKLGDWLAEGIEIPTMLFKTPQRDYQPEIIEKWATISTENQERLAEVIQFQKTINKISDADLADKLDLTMEDIDTLIKEGRYRANQMDLIVRALSENFTVNRDLAANDKFFEDLLSPVVEPSVP
jgi:hypothetical protein